MRRSAGGARHRGRAGNPDPATITHHPEGVRRTSRPQQPEQRRRDKGGAPQDSGRLKAGQPTDRGPGGHPHGSDKGRKGGGEGGGVPPAQKPEHP
ncbi:hypothetical protein SAMN05428944_6959 [Streptomyces sp. 1222.5]|nr:hypothetical protein BX260_1136 [Streptomyces sp. 5112.2]SED23522.1 hypothetical protein SAMN05428944_6959 [Streptomyces sp. 1222.5]